MVTTTRSMAKSSSPASAEVQHPQQEASAWEVLGAWCAKEEVKWYAENPGPYSPIDHRGKRGNKHFSKHLDDAVEVAEKRFAPCTEEEDNDHAASTNTISRSPFLLVATNVKAGWLPPYKYKNMRYMCTPMEGNAALCALFITCVSGEDKGLAHGCFSTLIDHYLRDNDLREVLEGMIAGGKEYQPDLSYIPTYPDPNPPHNIHGQRDTFKRMVVEIEFKHRSQSGLRKVGYAFLNGPNPYARLFVAIKIWLKDATTRNFAAAAIVWERTDPGVGPGNVVVHQALDFGTQRMSQRSINAWTVTPAAGDPRMLPPVDPNDWHRPDEFDNPLQEFQFAQEDPEIIPECCLILPKEAMFYRVGTPQQANGFTYITDFFPNLQDCAIDMRMYQAELNSYLDN